MFPEKEYSIYKKKTVLDWNTTLYCVISFVVVVSVYFFLLQSLPRLH